MPEIPPIKPTARVGEPASASDLSVSTGEQPFSLGQRLFARVVQMLGEGNALLDMAGRRFTASTPVPLAAGQILEVAVRGGGPVLDLELLDSPETISERTYALAAALEAKLAAPAAAARVPIDAIRTLVQSLPATPTPEGRAAATDLPSRAAATLLPLALDADGHVVAEGLRRAVLSSGAFFEARLAARSAQSGSFDVRPLADDAKAILAELAPHTAGSPALEATRAALATEVLARQADVAWRFVRDGEIRLDLPVLVGAAVTDVRLQVREEAPHSDEEQDAPSGRTVDLTLELPNLGRVRATLTWTPGHLATRFAVASAVPADTIQAELPAFDARLRAAGFRDVAVRVDIDPDAVAPVTEPPDPLPPGGSILNARA